MVSMLIKSSLHMLLFAVVYINSGFYLALVLTTTMYLCTGGYTSLRIMVRVLPRDIRLLMLYRRIGPKLMACQNTTIAEIFEKTAKKFPKKYAFVSVDNGKKMNFEEAQQYINRIANVFQNAGYKEGDHVALLMENDVEYIPTWIGLSKIGVVTALINTNLHGKSLAHSLGVVPFKGIIYNKSFENTIREMDLSIDLYIIKTITDAESDGKVINLYRAMQLESSGEPQIISGVLGRDSGLYIYTSGSTGKPKAAIISRGKVTKYMVIFCDFPDVTSEDVVYNSLPLYHTSGSLIFGAPTINIGCTMIIRKKFSATRFIADCVKYDVTYAGYIGEMLRYLLAQPPSELDKKHKIKTIFGNGLRRSLVHNVRDRFGFKNIQETYGATEGNTGFTNFDNQPGAVGFNFILFPSLNTNKIIKVNMETGELIRNKQGFGIECGVGEVGMMVGTIFQHKQSYDGYVNNKEESKKKIAENVFEKGDKVFLTGDLFERDEYHYLYFVDRIGDTFRWKGENVSTTEVENVITSTITTISEVLVYPVKIPGNEGSAGMAYIQEKKEGEIRIDQLAKELLDHLPKYAIPMFLRIGKSIDTTSTFKYMKSTLKQQAFNMDICDSTEKFYVYDIRTKDYIKLDENIMNDINDLKMRF